MKFIAEGGLTSKNVPANTRDSVLLTMYSDLASGISLHVFFTNDEEIVIASYNQVNLISKGKNDLSEVSSKKVLTYDVGSKVKSHNLMLLDQALNLFKNSTKLMVLKIDGQLLENNNFIEKFVSLISQYPTVNIYILSNNLNKLKELYKTSMKARVGIMVNKTNTEDLQEDFDFYSLDIGIVNNDVISRILNNNKDVFIDNVETVEAATYLNNSINSLLLKNIYIISSYIGPILSSNLLTTFSS